MLEEEKECTNCTFDTMAIVTVDINNWDYCPVCGSELRPADEDEEQKEDDMKRITIKTPDEDDSETQQTEDENENEEDNSKDEQESQDTDNQDDEVDEFVEEELERLRDNTEEGEGEA